ncbi:MAG: alpha/beta hydrolase [Candidatus Omnitrophica bacterium]|nr:alpha/beta hydrolase [Candidatus Omnitrophota bacterium]
MSKFRLLNRGARDTIVLIPGWAFDYRIFGPLEVGLNYLLPVEYSPSDFEAGLLAAMKNNKLKKVSILGWSMGSFLAFDLVSKYQDKVNGLIFVSVKKRYESERIKNMKRALKKNRRAILYKFYNDCFSENESTRLSWFKRHLLKSYLNRMNLDLLLEGLDYLLSKEIDPRTLAGVTSAMKFVHGKEDRIVSTVDFEELTADLPHIESIALERTGHIPFLNPAFKRIFL